MSRRRSGVFPKILIKFPDFLFVPNDGTTPFVVYRIFMRKNPVENNNILERNSSFCEDSPVVTIVSFIVERAGWRQEYP